MTATYCRNILTGRHGPEENLPWRKTHFQKQTVKLVQSAKVNNSNNEKMKAAMPSPPGVGEGLQKGLCIHRTPENAERAARGVRLHRRAEQRPWAGPGETGCCARDTGAPGACGPAARPTEGGW